MKLIYIIGAFAIWNIVVLILYEVDKIKAMHGKWRISENMLITATMLMGGVGGICGMVLFHHKVNKIKFRTLVPLALLITLIGLVGVVYLAR